MATLIQAVATYRPRVGSTRVVELDELAQRLSRGSLVTPSIARMVLADMCDEIRYFVRSGASVRIPGIGTFRPELRLDGSMYTTIRLDPKLRRNLTSVHDYGGEIDGRERIGMSLQDIKTLWDAEHPDDPLVLPVFPEPRAGSAPTKAKATSHRAARRAMHAVQGASDTNG